MSKKCKHLNLVRKGICRVKYCADCGAINLALGNMTLHLTDDQFEKLTQCLNEALLQKRVIDQRCDDQLAAATSKFMN